METGGEDAGALFAVSFTVTKTPSRNEIDKMHWGKRARVRGAYEAEILCAIGSRGRRLAKADGWRKVVITRYSTGRLDHDNLVGGCKQLIDAMVNLGLLRGDTPDDVEIEYRQQRSKRGDQRTTVEIT